MIVRDAKEERGLLLVLAAYLVVFGMKLAVYLVSGVMVLLAEALHTLSDIFISGFLLIAARYSRRRADEVYMFGYGRAQNVAALVAATLFISFTSFELYREAIPRLVQPAASEYKNLPLVIAVLAVSMLIAAIPLIKLFLQKERGAAVKAQLLELVNDELGLAAALAATLFIAWGYPLADPLAAIVVATIIAINAVGLFRENASFLMGRSPVRPSCRAERRPSVPGVMGVRDLRAEYVGPDAVHAGMVVEVLPGLAVEDASRIADEVHRRVHEDTHSGYCFIQVRPATPAADVAAAAPRGVATSA
jgi:cation diffusion facilitator family transporter